MHSSYSTLRQGAAWFDLPGRGKIRAAGEDRARLLHAMTTNHVQQLTPGQGCYLFFLTAQGRIIGDANVLAMEDHILIDTEPETRERLFQHIDKYIIADDVTVEDVTAEYCTLAVEGPEAGRLLHALAPALPMDTGSWTRWDGGIVARLNYTGADGYWVIAPTAGRDEVIRQLEARGIEAAAPEAVECLRIENGRARYGVDFGESNIPQETRIMRALHFTKGCYLGQEIVERVRSRGHVNKLLTRLRIAGESVPPAGAKVISDGKEVGEISSACFSPGAGKVVALGIVRSEFLRGKPLQVAGADAEALES